MPGRFDAYVFAVEGRFVVRPAVVALEKGSKFRIRNLTGLGISVELPEGLQSSPSKRKKDIGSGYAEFELDGGSGLYQYEVWVNVMNLGGLVRVQGESDPVIIIDPPGA